LRFRLVDHECTDQFEGRNVLKYCIHG
jgi:hypothetical protein